MSTKFSIIYPSRSRASICEETLKKWLETATEKPEVILSVDKDDAQLSKYKVISTKYGVQLLISYNKSAIEAINRAAKKTTGSIFLVVSDDFNSPPEKWDELLGKELEGKEDFIVKTQDGIQEWIITLPLMDRIYYNRFGYIYFPGYVHLFSDTEMSSVADITGRLIKSDIMIPHNHYSTGNFKKDAISVKNDKSWSQGKKLYSQRKAINFGL